MVAMGIAESGFAAMQSTLCAAVGCRAARGGAMGIPSACIGTQPLGTLAIGALAGTLGAPRAFALNAIVALCGDRASRDPARPRSRRDETPGCSPAFGINPGTPVSTRC